MTEYIERDVALEIVKRTSGDYAAAFAEIAHRPAADVAPVRWNSVDDRLPGEDLIGRQVICAVGHRCRESCVVAIFWWGYLDPVWQDVTHWMPLPEPPEDG